MAPKKKDDAEDTGGAVIGTDVGFIGDKVDPRPNEDHSLESGPDSPPVGEALEAQREAALASKNAGAAGDDA